MKWDSQQSEALITVDQWYKSYKSNPETTPQVCRVFGYAGTGKTTLAIHFANTMGGNVQFAAYTGKAALVLASKGAYNATTIHSLIYIPVELENGEVEFVLNPESELYGTDVLIIDECSMVDDAMKEDVLKFGCAVLVLGDPEQLPPPNGAGAFTNQTPDVMLTSVHRQAKESPIIWLATKARKKETLEIGKYGNCSVSDKISVSKLMAADQILCGKNATRMGMNSMIRRNLKFDGPYPELKDRMICTVSDKKRTGILNGEQFLMTGHIQSRNSANSAMYRKFQMASIDRKIVPNVKCHLFNFDPEIEKPDYKMLKNTQMVTFGYAITTHKSQGSQWDNVNILDESRVFRENWYRHLYTGITRSADEIHIVVQ